MPIDRGRSHFWAHVGVLACVCLAAACATHRPQSLSDRFIRPASPADLEDDIDLAPGALHDDGEAASVEVPQPRAATSDLPTIEREDRALSRAIQALSEVPSAEHYRRIGAEYRRLNIFDAAYTNLHRALKINPRDDVAYDELARLWRDAGLPDLALGDAHRAVSYAPASATAHNTLGTVFYALGDLQGAAREFRRVLELAPDAAWAQSNLCYIEFLRGDDAAATAWCNAAIAASPGLGAAHNNLALVHSASGRLDAARRSFIAGSGVAAGLYNVGIVHMARREYLLAADAFDAALRENPKLSDALRRAADARALAAKGARLNARKIP